jgi:hypothetical protein
MGILIKKNQFKTDQMLGRKLEMGQISGFGNFTPSYLGAKDEPSFIETFRNQEASQAPSTQN